MEKINFSGEQLKLREQFENVVLGVVVHVEDRMDTIKKLIVSGKINNLSHITYCLDRESEKQLDRYLGLFQPRETRAFKQFKEEFLTATNSMCTDIDIYDWSSHLGDGWSLEIKLKHRNIFQRIFGT